jgi:hypothetical protein
MKRPAPYICVLPFVIQAGVLFSQSALPVQKTQVGEIPKKSVDREIVHSEGGIATVYASTHTPLQDAILALNEEYGWSINYEDAPTVNPSDLVDDNAEFHLSHPGFHAKLLDGYSPKAKPFHSTFKEIDKRHADKDIAIGKVIQDYNESNNPGKYALIRTALNSYVIVGDEYKDKSGTEVKYSPILGCPISLTVSTMTLYDALQLVAKRFNDACKNDLNAPLDAEFAAEMLGPLAQEHVFGDYQGVAARDVIEDLLRQEPGLLYYSVEYVPGFNQFYLETWLTYRKVVGVDGNEVLDPVLNGSMNKNGKRRTRNEKVGLLCDSIAACVQGSSLVRADNGKTGTEVHFDYFSCAAGLA